MSKDFERREILKFGFAASIAPVIGCKGIVKEEVKIKSTIQRENNIFHSACRWCYNDIPLEELADKAKDIGLQSIELLDPEEWEIMLARGLNCAISNGSPLGITKGFNNPGLHKQLQEDLEPILIKAAEKGIPNVICFSGNTNGLSWEQGLENCAKGLEPLAKLAEKHQVNLVMELLNSKVDHADYQCDNSKWGTALVEKLGSPRFKLLYDIYHMQIMEGDVIATIRKNKDYIAHYHTGGVPGRNEIEENQELNYKAICEAIIGTGYKGFLGQEFIPTREDPFVSLRKAIDICDV